ncbi:unnamed protein product [Orchesella dallaii]|uniref:Uncharacterized protein n=1 Tax=Orchesella dallaii TaxID=48710 RepID=A0ABP1QEE7_9HEXA
MVPIEKHKARRRVRVIAQIFCGIHVVKGGIAVLLFFFSLWVAIGNNGVDKWNFSMARAPCDKAKPIYSLLPNMATLTAKEKSCLATESFMLSIAGVWFAIIQVSIARIYLKSTSQDMKGTVVFQLMDIHKYIQFGYVVSLVFILGIFYYFDGFVTPPNVLACDLGLGFILVQFMSKFLHEFIKEERMNIMLAERTQSQKEVQRCFDFPADINSTEFSLDNYPREDPADGRQIFYKLSGTIDFEKNGTCRRIEEARILSRSGVLKDYKVGSQNSETISDYHKYGEYITNDGRYFDGLVYHNVANYCVKRFGYYADAKTNVFTDIRICKETTTLDEYDRQAYCVKKCCDPNFIIDYSTRNCRPLKPNEPGWTPKVCDNADCQYENDFCRHGYGPYRPGSGKVCDPTVVRYSSKVKLEKANSQLHLMYKTSNDKWSTYEHPYCMDGFVGHRNLTFKNTPLDQVVVRCFDFPDNINSTDFSLDNYPREDPADGRQIHYTLSGSIDFEKNGTCKRIKLGRLLFHNGQFQDIKVGSVISELNENHNYGAYITRDGRYFDGLFYHKLANYCVFRFGFGLYPKTNTSWFTDIRICTETTILDEYDRRAYCVKKCCAPNFIIDYATGNCRPLKPNEPGWTPKICDNSDCQYVNDFCRHGYGLYTPAFGKDCAAVRYSSNVKLEKANSQLQLMYKASNGKWSRYEHEYCMDGTVDRRNLTFKNTPVDQAVVVCKKDAEGIDFYNSAYQLKFSLPYVLISVLVACFVVKNA